MHLAFHVLLPGTQPHPLLQHLFPGGTELALHTHCLATACGLDTEGASATPYSTRYVQRREELGPLLSYWERLLDEALLPLLRGCSSLEALERAVNGSPQAFQTGTVGVALAAAVGRDDLEAVAAARAPWHSAAQREGALALVEALRRPLTAELGAPATREDLALSAVVPLLRGGRPGLLAGPDGRYLPLVQQPAITPSIGELWALAVIDTGGAPRHLRHDQAEALGQTAAGLHQRALDNLRHKAAAGLRQTAEGPVTRLQLDGVFDASLVLLDELWDTQLAPQTPGGALVALPRPDLLLFCDVAAPGGLRELRTRVANAAGDAAAALTHTVFYREKGAWTALPAPR